MSNERLLYSNIASHLRENEDVFGEIPGDRRARLKEIARYVESRLAADGKARLTFICTHNSRRSQMSQIWAQTAAAYYGVPQVTAYSGGTEATAFDPRAVAALRRAGFTIEGRGGGENPVYEVRYGDKAPVIEAFSKLYHVAPNPGGDYCAVMTCSEADANCPVVHGASLRVAIPYEDPKDFDGTEHETAVYDERCRQISREMSYLLSLIE